MSKTKMATAEDDIAVDEVLQALVQGAKEIATKIEETEIVMQGADEKKAQNLTFILQPSALHHEKMGRQLIKKVQERKQNVFNF